MISRGSRHLAQAEGTEQNVLRHERAMPKEEGTFNIPCYIPPRSCPQCCCSQTIFFLIFMSMIACMYVFRMNACAEQEDPLEWELRVNVSYQGAAGNPTHVLCKSSGTLNY